ncbi:MAG: MotA/TolQ/ExbB proton channel family protein [Victivallaceae bacterium]|jgi:biopolymer transport protein ExbB|nr:MotA/TolQ/ExbB proton channel family protein [Victivallaceae bacterium]
MLFLKLMKDGGPVMWIILICSIIAMFVFLVKWFQFHREQINVSELIMGLKNVLRRNGFIEAISLCDNTPGPVARVLGATIVAYQSESDIEEAIYNAKLTEMPRLESNMNILGTVGYITPLLGLLGTVIGMMRAFTTISQSAYLSASLYGDISMALVTTAGGLCVAIPCYIAYNYLSSRIDSMTLEIDKASMELQLFFKEHDSKSTDGNNEKKSTD